MFFPILFRNFDLLPLPFRRATKVHLIDFPRSQRKRRRDARRTGIYP